MTPRHYIAFLLLVLTSIGALAHEKDTTRLTTPRPDTAVYQGLHVKLDLANIILSPATSHGQMQSYELAVSTQLIHRLFPTIEAGYSFGQAEKKEQLWHGQGGFMRIGLDLNPIRKRQYDPSALLVGVRLGTALQGYAGAEGQTLFGADCWGEIDAGCQVQIVKGLYMGWQARLKILFTRTRKDEAPMPDYIPGFGYRNDTGWGVNYYIGYRF